MAKYRGEIRTIGVCKVCGEHFDDYNGQQHRKYICRKCYNKHSKEMSRKYASTVEGFISQSLNGIINTPHRSRYGIDIDKEYLLKLYELQDGKCAISGIEMTYTFGDHDDKFGRRYVSPFNISVDRIDETKGYTKDNVWLVCVNFMKNNMSVENVCDVASAIHKNNDRHIKIKSLIDNMNLDYINVENNQCGKSKNTTLLSLCCTKGLGKFIKQGAKTKWKTQKTTTIGQQITNK